MLYLFGHYKKIIPIIVWPGVTALVVPLYQEVLEITRRTYLKWRHMNAKYLTAFYHRR